MRAKIPNQLAILANAKMVSSQALGWYVWEPELSLHPFLPQTVSEYLLFVRICSGYYARYLVYSDELKGHGPIPMVLTALRLLKTGDSLLLDLLLKYELVD